jgi:hypothetical protein
MKGVDVLHIFSHARYPRDLGMVGLFLEDEEGDVNIIKSDSLTHHLRRMNAPPRFCFLAGCETLSLGYELLAQTHVQAALAMNGLISIAATHRFTAQFYSGLLEHGILDLAASGARSLIMDDETYWGAPALLSRLPDNVLLAPQRLP